MQQGIAALVLAKHERTGLVRAMRGEGGLAFAGMAKNRAGMHAGPISALSDARPSGAGSFRARPAGLVSSRRLELLGPRGTSTAAPSVGALCCRVAYRSELVDSSECAAAVASAYVHQAAGIRRRKHVLRAGSRWGRAGRALGKAGHPCRLDVT